jgi:hypothetical protein
MDSFASRRVRTRASIRKGFCISRVFLTLERRLCL